MSFAELDQIIQANLPLFVILVVWSLIWKGLALWQAAQRGERGWFIALLILNTVGILELIYLFFVVKIGTPKAGATPE